MANYPEKAVYFVRIPRPAGATVPRGMTIVPPKEEPADVVTPMQIIDEVLAPKRTRKTKKSE
jgi:hypothetical protein